MVPLNVCFTHTISALMSFRQRYSLISKQEENITKETSSIVIQLFWYIVYHGHVFCFYVGRTKRCLKDRVAEHKYAFRMQNEDYPIVRHFKEVHVSDDSLLKIEGLELIKASIRGGEAFWIFKLDAMVYPGLNEEID